MRCARCKRPVVLGEQQGSPKIIPPPPEGSFKFLSLMEKIDTEQLTDALENMHANTILLRKHVIYFISYFKGMDRIPGLLPVLQNGIPVLKMVATTLGGGALVEIGNLLTEKIWSGVTGICQEVAERSCADVMMAAEYVDINATSNSISKSKMNAMVYFKEMYNCLQIESYKEDAKFLAHDGLKEFISRKLQGPMHMIASSYAHVASVLEAREANARLAQMSQRQPKQLSSGNDPVPKQLPPSSSGSSNPAPLDEFEDTLEATQHCI